MKCNRTLVFILDLTKGMTYISEIFTVKLSVNAFNFVLNFDDIFIQDWNGCLTIIKEMNHQKTTAVSIPDFTLPGIMKVVGSNIVISQGNRLLGCSIEKLKSGDQEYITVIRNHL